MHWTRLFFKADQSHKENNCLLELYAAQMVNEVANFTCPGHGGIDATPRTSRGHLRLKMRGLSQEEIYYLRRILPLYL